MFSDKTANTGTGLALKEGSTTEYNQTQYAYDPMDRTTQKISKAGTANAKTTDFAYHGKEDKEATTGVDEFLF